MKHNLSTLKINFLQSTVSCGRFHSILDFPGNDHTFVPIFFQAQNIIHAASLPPRESGVQALVGRH